MLTAMLTLCALSYAGEFTFTPGSWTSTTLTGSTGGATVTTTSDPTTIASSLGVQATASGTYTLQGTWTYNVPWVADSKDETPPTSVQITLWRCGTPTVAGSGTASITSGSTTLVSVDSTTPFQSGGTFYTPDVVVTLPLVEQPDGSYQASGSIDSDTISVTYDDSTGTSTNCVESFSLGDIEAVSP